MFTNMQVIFMLCVYVCIYMCQWLLIDAFRLCAGASWSMTSDRMTRSILSLTLRPQMVQPSSTARSLPEHGSSLQQQPPKHSVWWLLKTSVCHSQIYSITYRGCRMKHISMFLWFTGHTYRILSENVFVFLHHLNFYQESLPWLCQ